MQRIEASLGKQVIQNCLPQISRTNCALEMIELIHIHNISSRLSFHLIFSISSLFSSVLLLLTVAGPPLMDVFSIDPG